jgi:hypothetical protein
MIKPVTNGRDDGCQLDAKLSRVESGEERERVERAKAESIARTLEAELTELRDEKRKTLETVTAWVERASRAEARLEELERGAGEQGDRS